MMVEGPGGFDACVSLVTVPGEAIATQGVASEW